MDDEQSNEGMKSIAVAGPCMVRIPIADFPSNDSTKNSISESLFQHWAFQPTGGSPAPLLLRTFRTLLDGTALSSSHPIRRLNGVCEDASNRKTTFSSPF